MRLYQWFWQALLPIIAGLARLKPQLKAQIEGRSHSLANFSLWNRDSYRSAVIFFASSAGEYEQAKPLAQRLQREGRFILFVFGSASGVRFAEAQGETLPYIKAPWDQPREWLRIFRAVKPDFTIIIRYELWPGFLAIAKQFGKIYLVNAVKSQGLNRKALSRWIWCRMLRSISEIFVVGDSDRAFYTDRLGQAGHKVHSMGDTKYDRVFERIAERASQSSSLKSELDPFLRDAQILIIGSAWLPDLNVVLSVWKELRLLCPPLKLLVVPHDIGQANAGKMEAALQGAGLRTARASRSGMGAATAADDALLVDRLGLLPELYGLAHIAWVGGGMHFRVHNVLEPACRGIYICFGPRYQSSQEAVWLVEKALAQVIQNGGEFLSAFEKLTWNHKPPHQALWQAVEKQRGTSERILRAIARSEIL